MALGAGRRKGAWNREEDDLFAAEDLVCGDLLGMSCLPRRAPSRSLNASLSGREVRRELVSNIAEE
jgi:hypothetical protein